MLYCGQAQLSPQTKNSLIATNQNTQEQSYETGNFRSKYHFTGDHPV